MERQKYTTNQSAIHDVIVPEDIRSEDRVRAKIRVRNQGSEFTDVRVWRLSPLGVELVVREGAPWLNRGVPLDLEITVEGDISLFEGVVVDSFTNTDDGPIIGVRFHAPNLSEERSHTDRRDQTRWLCSGQFLPVCVCPSPVRFNHFVRLRMIDVSLKGARLVTSLSNKFLIPGIVLDITASFPLTGTAKVRARIVRVEIGATAGREELVLGVSFLSIGSSDKSIIAHYLVQFQSASSLDELRKSGFEPASISVGTTFTFVKTEEEYEEVLKLRLKAYKAAGKYEGEEDHREFSDRFDATSRVVVGRFSGKVVASARVNFPGITTPLEQEQYIEWTSDFPRRDEIIEITRACTDPEFRRSDLLAAMFRFMCVTCVTAERPYTVTMATPKMSEFYEKIGLEPTGLHYNVPLIGGDHEVLIGHSIKAMSGRRVNPLYWNFVWREASDHLIKSGVVKPNGIDKIVRRLYLLLAPLSRALFRLKSRPRPATPKSLP